VRLDSPTVYIHAQPEAPKRVTVTGAPVEYGTGEGEAFVAFGEIDADQEEGTVITAGFSFRSKGSSEVFAADVPFTPEVEADIEAEEEIPEDKQPAAFKARLEEEQAKADQEDDIRERIEAEQRGEYVGAVAPTAAAAAGAAPSPRAEQKEEKSTPVSRAKESTSKK
jgi:hypothetical protein